MTPSRVVDDSRDTMPGAEGAARPLILIVEEPSMRRVVRCIVASRGFATAEMSTADEAVQVARTTPPALIIFSLDLPALDFNRRAQELRACTTAPILVTSWPDDTARVAHAIDGGADEYLLKPFSGMDLMRAVERLLSSPARAATREDTDGPRRLL